MLEKGRDSFLAVIGKGEELSSVREKMEATAARIEREFGEIISGWKGETEDFLGAESVLEELVN